MSNDAAVLDARVPNPEFMDNYDTGQSDFTPPPQPKIVVGGRTKYVTFLAQAPTVDKIKLRDENHKPLTTRDGWLKAIVDGIKLVESGYTFGQTHIGTGQYKKYDRKTNQPIAGEFRNASPALDYLRSQGIDLKPSTVEEYEQYFQATADRQFQVTTNWSAWDKDTQSDVASKWEDFPDASTDVEAFGRLYPGVDPTGAKLPFVQKGEKRFWARANVKAYVSAVADAKK